MLKGITKHEDKEHGKTLKHEAPRSLYHKATQNKNNTGTMLECLNALFCKISISTYLVKKGQINSR